MKFISKRSKRKYFTKEQNEILRLKNKSSCIFISLSSPSKVRKRWPTEMAQKCQLIQNKTVSFKKSKIQSCSENKISLITIVKDILKHIETLIFCQKSQNYTTFYLVKTRVKLTKWQFYRSLLSTKSYKSENVLY